MEAAIPGFGGFYYDTESGQMVVHLRDIQASAGAMNELRRIAPTIALPSTAREKLGVEGSTTVRRGDFSFSELVAWTLAIARQPRLPGLLAIDADERLNRVRLSVSDNSVRPAVLAMLVDAGVPEAAVAFELRAPGRLLATVQQRVRPTGGGLQIQNSGTGLCTLGFNVDVQFYGEKGFLTASHCDTGNNGAGTTGDTIYQNTKLATNRVGSVAINPPWNSTDPGCSGITLCTSADAMFVRAFAETTSVNWQKRVARTAWGSNNAAGGLTILSYYSSLSIVPFLYTGATVYKVGRTTGGTVGTIGGTCEYPTYSSNTYAFLCVSRVDGASNDNGDSGAPVYYPPAGGEPAYAIGIVFAGGGTTYSGTRCTSGCYYHFSEWYAIEAHLSRYFSP